MLSFPLQLLNVLFCFLRNYFDKKNFCRRALELGADSAHDLNSAGRMNFC